MMWEEMRLALWARGAKSARVVDTSMLSRARTWGLPRAVVLILPLRRGYLRAARAGEAGYEEFVRGEREADALADWLADSLHAQGFRAVSQSEAWNAENLRFDPEIRASHLPSKTLARLAGLGWIGKNALLVSPEYGPGVCIGSVLTNAPLPVDAAAPMQGLCGPCTVCVDACACGVLADNAGLETRFWEELPDMRRCDACMRCLTHCPWAARYAAN